MIAIETHIDIAIAIDILSTAEHHSLCIKCLKDCFPLGQAIPGGGDTTQSL
jgi:hypothetical protein